MTLGCYVRVSTIDQNYELQVEAIQKWLDANGIADVRWFCDKSTGDDTQRPAFQAMQAAIFAGEVDGVVVWKLDRLSRKLVEGLNILAGWLDNGLRFVSITQQLDFRGVMGKMMAAMLLGIAEIEQQTRRERIMAGIARAKVRGVYKGGKPGRRKRRNGPEQVRQLRARGMKVLEIAKLLEVSKRTVCKYMEETEYADAN